MGSDRLQPSADAKSRDAFFADRPVGLLKPIDPNARRAFKAIEQDRLSDAEHILAGGSTDELADQAWRFLLQSIIAVERAQLRVAEPLGLQAIAFAFVAGERAGVESATNHDRLKARTLHHVGRIYRRQERPTHALCAHMKAYSLREQSGSLEELWESATAIGQDFHVACRHDNAKHWHFNARDIGERSTEEPERKMAESSSSLVASLLETGEFAEAVTMSKKARNLWQQHDAGAVTAAMADLALGTTLLQYGQSLFDDDPHSARPALIEALTTLKTADESLTAFGGAPAADIKTCRDLVDLTQRLLSS